MAHLHNEKNKNVRCMIITVSDTRKRETDKSGQSIKKILEKHNHVVQDYKIVRDEKEEINKAIQQGLKDAEIEAILLNGGTGIAKRDVTIEVVQSILDKELPGFGELFRYLSYQYDIGSAAILSRATAGVARDTAVFAMPGSTGAVKLAMERLVMKELIHVVTEIKK